MFPHKGIHKGTWRSPERSSVNQIDHVCISQGHRQCLLDVRYMRGADLGLSDHYLVRAKITVKLRKEHSSCVTGIHDSPKLESEQVQVEFREEVECKMRQNEADEGVEHC